jgi:hypothetical protein
VQARMTDAELYVAPTSEPQFVFEYAAPCIMVVHLAGAGFDDSAASD